MPELTYFPLPLMKSQSRLMQMSHVSNPQHCYKYTYNIYMIYICIYIYHSKIASQYFFNHSSQCLVCSIYISARHLVQTPQIRYICPLVTNLGIFFFFTLTPSWSEWLNLPCLLAAVPPNQTFHFQTFESDMSCGNSVETHPSLRKTYKHADLGEGRKS